MYKLSIIIPVYNKAPFLRRALDSVARQMNDSTQVIIIDDGSTDGSSQICDEYSQYNFEIYHTENRGVSEARNLGLDKAEGEYIAFLDGDDAYVEGAISVMTKITRHQMNIIQFGQFRCHPNGNVQDPITKGHTTPDRLPRRWTMAWNKMYKRDFVEKNSLRFIKGMQFGEDEIFNVQAILANGGLYHAPQTLILHYFDDKKSLCRGELNVERLTGLVNKLLELAKEEPDRTKAQWMINKAHQHEVSPLFKKFNYKSEKRAVTQPRKCSGKYDIVYFLKDTPTNEELRYSLRSVEQNWHYKNVWFFGGCPEGLHPDHHVKIAQTQPSKWERVRNMLYQACLTDSITEDFWLFNDDFFILQPVAEDMPPQYNGTLKAQIERVEKKHGYRSTDYTRRLRHLLDTLRRAGKPTLNYSVHKPMLINRKKMLEVLDKYPDEPMSRALYGNYWGVGGEDKHDNKVMIPQYNLQKIQRWRFLSTSDSSFSSGNIGTFVRRKFMGKSRFEG